MALAIFLAAVGAGMALYAGLLWLAARSKRPVGPRPEARESYRDAEPVVVVDEPSEHFVGQMGDGALFIHDGPTHGCPICATLPPVARPGTCDTLGQLHDGVPVEVLLARKGGA